MTRIMRSISIFLLLLSFGTTQAQTPPTYKVAVSYFAAYRCPYQAQGEQKLGQPVKLYTQEGTAFAWGEEYLVTAYHVVAASCEPYIEVVDQLGQPYQAEFIGGETLLDIAVLRLPTPQQVAPPKTSQPTINDVVEVIGYDLAASRINSSSTMVSATDICMPGCFGSHLLTFELLSSYPDGYSGSPVMSDDAIVGMLLASNRKEGKGYAINGDILTKTVNDLIQQKRKKRAFSGIVWKDTRIGPRMENLLSEADPRLRPHIGGIVTHINGVKVTDLNSLRTELEQINPTTDNTLQYTIEANGQIVNLILPTMVLSDKHYQEIVNYFFSYKLLPFQLDTDNADLTIVNTSKYSDLKENDVLQVVGLENISSGIRCENKTDLGIILRTFSPTDTELTFFFKSKQQVKTKMQGILIN